MDKPRKLQISISLSQDTIAKLDDRARERRLSRSAMTEVLVERALLLEFPPSVDAGLCQYSPEVLQKLEDMVVGLAEYVREVSESGSKDA